MRALLHLKFTVKHLLDHSETPKVRTTTKLAPILHELKLSVPDPVQVSNMCYAVPVFQQEQGSREGDNVLHQKALTLVQNREHLFQCACGTGRRRE